MIEGIKHVGKVSYVLKNNKGEVKETREIDNLVVSTGKAGMAGLLVGTGGVSAFEYIALGTGSTTPAAGDTALEAEITSGGAGRALASTSRVTTGVTDDTSQLQATFNFTASHTITESGVLNADSGGVLLARQVFFVLNVSDGDELTVRWRIQHS